MPNALSFIVLGLPRSGTTWLANWLTTDASLCLHDPFATALPEDWASGGKRLGIACTGAYLMPAWLAQQTCPVAIIEREPVTCDRSLSRCGLPPTTSRMRRMLGEAVGRRWTFKDIWNEAEARNLWAFLLPGVEFNAARYRLLCQMQVQPHLGKWKPDAAVARELINRNMLVMEDEQCLGV